jgi:hypothetical protein
LESFKIPLVHDEEVPRRSQELLHQLRLRPHATRREDDQLDAAVVRNRAPLGEAELLETIDDPRRVGRVAASTSMISSAAITASP